MKALEQKARRDTDGERFEDGGEPPPEIEKLDH
jgi:hypothetical protein